MSFCRPTKVVSWAGKPGAARGEAGPDPPEALAHNASWVREYSPSLLNACSTCPSIVRSERKRRSAMARFVSPWATSSATSRSRRERTISVGASIQSQKAMQEAIGLRVLASAAQGCLELPKPRPDSAKAGFKLGPVLGDQAPSDGEPPIKFSREVAILVPLDKPAG